MTRRAEKPITIRSDRASARLRLLTQAGRSQVSIVEEALDRMPVPQDERALRRARVYAAIDRLAARGGPSMAEFDAREYDERGNPR